MGEEAYLLLTEETGFDAMKKVKSLLPDSALSDEWKDKAYTEMLESCQLKYTACPHARDKLLTSKMTIVEATGDPFWGSGLNIQQTLDCLPDFWPGDNNLGKTLMQLHSDLQDEDTSDGNKKRKAASLLGSDCAKVTKS